MADKNETVLAFTGNALIQHRLSVYREPAFLKLADMLRNADASFTNLEGGVQNGEDFPTMSAGNGRSSSPMAIPPACVDELQWMGIKMVYAANNHASDFLEGGILTTIAYLNEADMPYAGIGANLTEATAPGYLETPKGRVALIAASDWGPRGARDLPFPPPLGVFASDQSPQYRGRPGVNLLRYEINCSVDAEALQTLRRISKGLGWEEAKAARSRGFGANTGAEPLMGPSIFGEPDTDTSFSFMGTKFLSGGQYGIATVPYEEDLARNNRWIKEARRQADWVVVALHDQGNREEEDAEYVRIFARGAIDAGADVFVAHGGRVGGIEVYKGKVIIYGQPSFVMQLHQLQRVPLEMMARRGLGVDNTPADFIDSRVGSMARATGMAQRMGTGSGSTVTTVVYDDNGTPKEVRIHPLELSGGSRSRQGRPMLADPSSPAAKQVLDTVVRRSKMYGTRVDLRDGIGVVSL